MRDAARGGDEQERSRAAARLLDWPDAWPVWPQVLDALLRGQVTLGAEHQRLVAPLLTRWPADPGARRVAGELLQRCSPQQRREFVRGWIELRYAGDAGVAESLRSLAEEELPPRAWEAAERGDHRLAQLLRPGRSPALRSFVAWVGRARRPRRRTSCTS